MPVRIPIDSVRFSLLAIATLLGLATQAFAASPAPTPDGEPPPDALVDEIPFHPSAALSRVVIDLAPDGRPPFLLWLDTGAAGTILTPLAARNLGVSVRANKSSPYRRATRLGRDVQFRVDTSASDTGVQGGSFEYALLGSDFLDDFVVEIDYPGRMVRFYDPKKYAVPETSPSPDVHVLPFKRNGTRILVDVELEGHTFEALLDTGAPGVVVEKREAKKAGIPKSDLEEELSVRWVIGESKNRVYQTKDFRLGGMPLPSMPILIQLKSPMQPMSVLGYDAFGRYVVRIDYERKRISLRRPKPDDPPFQSWLEAYRNF